VAQLFLVCGQVAFGAADGDRQTSGLAASDSLFEGLAAVAAAAGDPGQSGQAEPGSGQLPFGVVAGQQQRLELIPLSGLGVG
jgi:hypothetical protein